MIAQSKFMLPLVPAGTSLKARRVQYGEFEGHKPYFRLSFLSAVPAQAGRNYDARPQSYA